MMCKFPYKSRDREGAVSIFAIQRKVIMFSPPILSRDYSLRSIKLYMIGI